MKKFLCLVLSLICVFSCFSGITASAEQTDESIKILLIGNSLMYYNDMDTKTLPDMLNMGDKRVEVTSITESATTLYRLASEKTSVGKKVLLALEENTYDYLIIHPGRRVTPFEYSVYNAEKAAAQKLCAKAEEKGTKTLILATSGFALGNIPVYTMDESGTDSTQIYKLPMDRKTHSIYFENLCADICSSVGNAQVVPIGKVVETYLSYYDDYRLLYQKDDRHPTELGSYLQALCIYNEIFDTPFISDTYFASCSPDEAMTAQAVVDIALNQKDESVLNINAPRTLQRRRISNCEVELFWQESSQADYYMVYRRRADEEFSVLATTTDTSYIDNTLETGYKYYYRIKAVKQYESIQLTSDFSSYVPIITLSPSTLTSVKLVDKNTATLTFSAVKNVHKYNIYRRKNNETDYTYIGSTKALKFTDYTMKSGNIYCYSVRASRNSDEFFSEYSNELKVASLEKPKATFTPAKKKITVKISKVKSATKYRIYFKKYGAKSYKVYTTTTSLKTEIKGLQRKTKYRIKIKAYNQGFAGLSSYYTVKTK